jgi:hypothetical protein
VCGNPVFIHLARVRDAVLAFASEERPEPLDTVIFCPVEPSPARAGSRKTRDSISSASKEPVEHFQLQPIPRRVGAIAGNAVLPGKRLLNGRAVRKNLSPHPGPYPPAVQTFS